ncbi:DUF6221 family protein [Streptomyces sp. NPDC055817]
MDELVQWYGAQLDDDESAALGAKGKTAGRWTQDDGPPEDIVLCDESGRLTMGQARHIARHDPARVLREIDGKRQLLADLLTDQHFHNEEDNWYSCASLVGEDGKPVCIDDSRAPGPCDCGRDARVKRRVALLALPYADRPGYKEEWRP